MRRERSAARPQSRARVAVAALAIAGLGLPVTRATAAAVQRREPIPGTALELIDRGLDPERGIYGVTLVNRDRRSLTAAGVELLVVAPSGRSSTRGLVHDVVRDRPVPSDGSLDFEIGVDTPGDPELWAFSPRFTFAIFADREWIGDERRAEQVFLARASDLLVARRFLVRLERAGPLGVAKALGERERRGKRDGASLDLLAHPTGSESTPEVLRRFALAASRGQGAQAAQWRSELAQRADDSTSYRVYLNVLREQIAALEAGSRSGDTERIAAAAPEVLR